MSKKEEKKTYNPKSSDTEASAKARMMGKIKTAKIRSSRMMFNMEVKKSEKK